MYVDTNDIDRLEARAELLGGPFKRLAARIRKNRDRREAKYGTRSIIGTAVGTLPRIFRNISTRAEAGRTAKVAQAQAATAAARDIAYQADMSLQQSKAAEGQSENELSKVLLPVGLGVGAILLVKALKSKKRKKK